jgi:hypothetical protein
MHGLLSERAVGFRSQKLRVRTATATAVSEVQNCTRFVAVGNADGTKEIGG